MPETVYREIPRADALQKVRGEAIYGADDMRTDMVHGVFAVAAIGRGALAGLAVDAARDCPGVRLVLTHEDMEGVKSSGFLMAGGAAFQSFLPMLSTEITYRGQPIALVLADSYAAAVEGASRVEAHYAERPHQVALAGAPDSDVIEQAKSPLPQPMFADPQVGDADTAFAAAAAKVDIVVETPAQHQNPIELIATVAEWKGDTLVIREGTQNAASIRSGLATQLSMAPDKIEVHSPYCGGGFGQKNSEQMQTVFAAIAARRLNRPVKIVVPRSQLFHDASFRPASRQRVRLGADPQGGLLAAIHEIDVQTSRHDLFPSEHASCSARLYGYRSFRGLQRLVRADTQTPGYMRAPFEHGACFAMETAVDALACAIRMDPVALRLANDTQVDALTRLPLSSRHVGECLTRGAEIFGWHRRSHEPQSMSGADGTQIGWGVAIGCYPTLTVAAIARITAYRDGRIELNAPGHEMGQGIRTALANALAEELEVSPDAVTVRLGELPGVPQHLTAGSWGTATAIPVAVEAARALRTELEKLAPGNRQMVPAEALERIGKESVTVEVQRKAPGQSDGIFDQLRSDGLAIAGPEYPGFVTYSYVAHFVEVNIETTTRRIRVPRVVSVVDCGTVISPRTARSQLWGGVVWGLGAALREESEVDPRFGGFLNADIAEYAISVNADIHSIEVDFINKPDLHMNDIGAKGLGEVAMVGVAPAVGNAIYHATGRRLTKLPFRIEHLL
jgi:xanthine dehydrogenase YagR molybdenum-binding subunit